MPNTPPGITPGSTPFSSTGQPHSHNKRRRATPAYPVQKPQTNSQKNRTPAGFQQESAIRQPPTGIIGQARTVLYQCLQNDPLFAPHAEFVYERQKVLGEGGMGVVYLVKDKRSGRFAALKTLKARASNLAHQRFMREALITARLDHPNIPPVLELGRTSLGDLYLLMKWIRGENLRDELKGIGERSPNSPQTKRILANLVKVAEAIAYAHSQNIVHRDLKPSNVMLGEFGEVMVVDWGIARDLTEAHEIDAQRVKVTMEFGDPESISQRGTDTDQLTRVGAAVGTPGYMSPEQARGDDVDASSDVFALGSILTEILTGDPACAGDSAQIRFAGTLAGIIGLPKDRDPSVPFELNEIARQALLKDRSERTHSAEFFVTQLRAYLNDEPVPGVEYSSIAKLKRTLRQHALTAVSIGAIVLLLSISFTLLTIVYFQSENAAIAQERKRVAEKLLKAAEREALAAETQKQIVESAANKQTRAFELFAAARVNISQGVDPDSLEQTVKKALTLSKRSYQALITAADIYLQQNNLRESERLLIEASREHPPGFEALYYLHCIQSRRAELRYDDVIITDALRQLIDKVRTSQSSETSPYILLGRALTEFQNHDYSAVVKVLDKIESQSPDFAENFYIRGMAHLKLRKFRRCADDLSTSIRLKPTQPSAYLNRARTYGFLQQFDRALADVKQALEWHPFSYQLIALRGYLLYLTGNLKEGRRDLERSIELNHRYGRAYNYLAEIDAVEKKYDSAIVNYTRAIQLSPDDLTAYNNRAGVYQRVGKLDLAIQDINHVIKMSPNSVEYRRERSILRLNQYKAFEEIVDDCNLVLKANPKDLQIRCFRAIGLAKTGRVQFARKDLAVLAGYSNATLPQQLAAAAISAATGKVDDARKRYQFCLERFQTSGLKPFLRASLEELDGKNKKSE